MNGKELWTAGILIAAVSAAFISGCKGESKTESIQWTKSSSEAALDGQNGQDEQDPQGGNDPAAIPGASSGGNSSTGADATSYGYPDYYYSPSEDGYPVILYQDSDDRVDKPVYNGSLYIRKDATVETAIDNQTEPVTLSALLKDFNWYNGVYFDQKGYVTRLVFYGD